MRAAALGIATLLAGCAALQPPFAAPPVPLPAMGGCGTALAALQAAIDAAGVDDRWHHPVDGQPSYRSSRFLASFEADALSEDQRRAWRAALHAAGMQDLVLAWQRLPPPTRAAWSATTGDADVDAFVARCDAPLARAAQARALASGAVQVPDAYSDLQRVLGLYPLVRHLARPSILAHQQALRITMADADPFTGGTTRLYRPPPAPAGRPPAIGPRSALGVPQPDAQQLQALLAYHAPRVQVAERSSADRIGTPAWRGGERVLRQDVPPTLFTQVTHMRSQAGVLLQLNYTLWFPARPPASAGDPYAGFLDGLVWRVTLAADGTVLFYDSIHPCGCYHSIHLPRGAALPVRPNAEADEPLMVFHAPVNATQRQPVLWVRARTHDLLRVQAEPTPGGLVQDYRLEDHHQLRVLPDGTGGARSWYDADGLIADSARAERFFLWPLGVPSAGAMRQPGRQAITFLGRRHFDDAWLEDWLRAP